MAVVNKRMAQHFLMLGTELSDFEVGIFAPFGVAGNNSISDRPVDQTAYETLFGIGFPEIDLKDLTFARKLGHIMQSWVRAKGISPILRDDEVAGLRWLILGKVPFLPHTMDSMLYAISGIKPKDLSIRPQGYSLTEDEIQFLKDKLRFLFPKVQMGHDGPDAHYRRTVAKEKAENLAKLVFQYKIEQMEWEDGVPMCEDTRSPEEIVANADPKLRFFYPDTEEREKDAKEVVARKRKRLEQEAEALQQTANNMPLPPVGGNAPSVAFTFTLPGGILGGGADQTIEVMQPNPENPESMIRASLLGAWIQRVSIANSELYDAEKALKRVKADDTEKKRRWEEFIKLGDRVEAAFLEANAIRAGQVASVESARFRSNVHNYDKPMIVTREERAMYNAEKGKSAFVGNIDNKFTSAQYGGLGVFQ